MSLRLGMILSTDCSEQDLSIILYSAMKFIAYGGDGIRAGSTCNNVFPFQSKILYLITPKIPVTLLATIFYTIGFLICKKARVRKRFSYIIIVQML